MPDDNLFNEENLEKLNEFAFKKSASFMDLVEHPFFAKKALIICILANIFLFASSTFLPNSLKNLLTNILNIESSFGELFFLLWLIVYFLYYILPFVLGFCIGYASIKLINSSSKQNRIPQEDNGIMNSYLQSEYKNSQWYILLISSASGLLNFVFFLIFPAIIKDFFIK